MAFLHSEFEIIKIRKFIRILGIAENKRETEKVDPIVSLLVSIELAESFPMVCRT